MYQTFLNIFKSKPGEPIMNRPQTVEELQLILNKQPPMPEDVYKRLELERNELQDRYHKLAIYLNKLKDQDFEDKPQLKLLKKQVKVMKGYLDILNARMEVESKPSNYTSDTYRLLYDALPPPPRNPYRRNGY